MAHCTLGTTFHLKFSIPFFASEDNYLVVCEDKCVVMVMSTFWSIVQRFMHSPRKWQIWALGFLYLSQRTHTHISFFPQDCLSHQAMGKARYDHLPTFLQKHCTKRGQDMREQKEGKQKQGGRTVSCLKQKMWLIEAGA